MCVYLPPIENVEDKEIPPKRRHVEVQVQLQPENTEESQGIITDSAFYCYCIHRSHSDPLHDLSK